MNAIIPADALAQAEAHVLKLERQHPEMAYKAVHRVNVVMSLISSLVWYGPYNVAIKQALDAEYKDADEEFRKWYFGGEMEHDLRRHEAENRRKSGIR